MPHGHAHHEHGNHQRTAHQKAVLLTKGSIKCSTEKGGVHVRTTNKASNKEIDKHGRVAHQVVESQGQHYKNTAQRDTAEIPSFAMEPGPALPPLPPGLTA